MTRSDDLSGPAQQRLRAVLGVIGDDTDPPRPFVRLTDRTTYRTTKRPHRTVWALPVLLVVAVVAVIGFAWRQSQDRSSSIVPATPPTLASAPTTAEPTGSVLPGPWFRVVRPDVRVGKPTSSYGSGMRGGAAWITNDGSWSRVLVVRQLPPVDADAAPRPDGSTDSTLTGDDGAAVAAPSGELRVVVDSAQTGLARQMRWTRTSGERWEFSSFGLTPDELASAVQQVATVADQTGCPCPLDGFDLVASYASQPESFTHQQTIEAGRQSLVLSRSTDALHEIGVGFAGRWSTIEPRLIAGHPGALIDGTMAVWTVDGYWFTLWSLGYADSDPLASVDQVLALIEQSSAEPYDPPDVPTSQPIDEPVVVWPYPTRFDAAVIRPNPTPDPADVIIPTTLGCISTYELRPDESVSAAAERLGVPLDIILAINNVDLDNTPLNVPCGTQPAVVSTDRSGLERYSNEPDHTPEFDGHNRLILATDRRVILLDGGTSPEGGAIRLSLLDRPTGTAISGSQLRVPECQGPIEMTANTDPPLDSVPFTCTTDGRTGTVDAFSGSVTYPA